MALRSRFLQDADAPQSHIDLNFLQDSSEYETTKPYYISGPLKQGFEEARTNIKYQELKRVPLFDLRGQERGLSLEKHGLEILDIPADIERLDVKAVEAQREEYMERMAETVKKRLGASFVLCYNYKVGTIWMWGYFAVYLQSIADDKPLNSSGLAAQRLMKLKMALSELLRGLMRRPRQLTSVGLYKSVCYDVWMLQS